MNRNEVLHAILTGLNKAKSNYLKWTHDTAGLTRGAEYVLSTYAAEELGKLYPGHLSVDKPMKEFFAEARQDTAVDTNDLCRLSGRADIALLYNKEKPKAIIEIQSGVSDAAKLQEDIDRITCLLDIEVIEYGVIAFTSEIETTDVIRDSEMLVDEVKKTLAAAREYAGSAYEYQFDIQASGPMETGKEGYWSWASAALLFSK